MPTFEWHDFFSVGHEEIDNQHKQLFAIVNELYDGLRSGDASPELTKETVAALCSYTRKHFTEEEQLMLAAGYPDLERHKQSHDQLIVKVDEFEARIRDGEAKVAIELLPFLVGEWLSHHIAFEDQQYAGYLNSHVRRQRARQPQDSAVA